MLPNPYRPGAGMSPAYLAGRDNTINEAQNILHILHVQSYIMVLEVREKQFY